MNTRAKLNRERERERERLSHRVLKGADFHFDKRMNNSSQYRSKRGISFLPRTLSLSSLSKLAENLANPSLMSFPPPLPASVYRSRLILLPSVQGSYKAIETFHGIQATASYWQTVGGEEERTNKDANVSASIGSDRKETSCCPQIRARDSFCSAILSLSLSFSLSKVDSLKKKERERERKKRREEKDETNVGSPFGSFCEFLKRDKLSRVDRMYGVNVVTMKCLREVWEGMVLEILSLVLGSLLPDKRDSFKGGILLLQEV